MKKATFMITSHSVLLRMVTISDNSSTENHNTHFIVSNFFPRQIMGKNMVEPYRPQMTIYYNAYTLHAQ